MLDLIIPSQEFFNEETSEFVYTKPQNLQLEHSLVSISKWESKWNKPFLDKNDKTTEEILDYIRCMTVTQNVKSDIFINLPSKIYDTIRTYIDSKMTATWFNEQERIKKSNEVVTAEIIYYWMIIHNIPPEYQNGI